MTRRRTPSRLVSSWQKMMAAQAGGSVGACIGGADGAAVWKCGGGEIIPARGRVGGYFSEMGAAKYWLGRSW